MQTAISSIEGRQLKLVISVIENYIETAEPVGSRFLAYKKNIGWSEATIRNDFRVLEEAGLLIQPHTSAGRIPTMAGYRFYTDRIKAEKIKIKEQNILAKAFREADSYEIGCKSLAKEAALITREAVIMAFNPDKIFYTGLSNIFEKPEFASTNMVINTSRMFDQCEECLDRFFNKVSEEVKIYIGSEHPFGSHLSVVAARLNRKNNELFMVFGPMRMNYKKNLAIVEKIKEILNQ
jgi:transcriptional regulator of heat shock response